MVLTVNVGLVTIAVEPMLGNHVYVTAPVAVKLAVCPEQMVALFTPTVDAGITFTVPVAVAKQPPVALTVTVYNVVTAGLTINGLRADAPVAQDQL